MPKYPDDKRRYYSDMGDKGRAPSRGPTRGREARRDEQISARSDQYGAGPSGRRPGHAVAQSSTAPYSRPSTSSAPSGAAPYHVARGEEMRQTMEHRPQPAFSETASDAGSVAGSSRGDSKSQRGAVRGKRILPVDIITRPRHIESKVGGYGRPITLEANYFKLLTTTDWCLYKYKVNFAPEEDRNVIRKGLLRPHRETLGAYIFDGSTLYTSNRLPEPLELTSERQADQQVMLITFQAVGDMNAGDHHYIQFFNIIMRKCLDYLQLRLVGRNYFDAAQNARIDVSEFRLQLWPGYITSIRQHEHDILMCAEITHKVMRSETLLDVLRDCYHNNRQNYGEQYKRDVIGTVVLTDYNNNTYRIDDVDFEVTPLSTFTRRDGVAISYNEYYQTRYNITIRDPRQPLLVSRSKPRDVRAGRVELVYLVPELCRPTGITDRMRSNFKLMNALGKHTRVSPADRIRKLLNFNTRLRGVPNVVEELRSWNLTLDQQLVKLPARVFPPDNIIFGKDIKVAVPVNANWTNDVRKIELRKTGVLDEWALVVTGQARRDCQYFVNCLIRAASGMQFKIGQPQVFDIRDDNASAYTEVLEHIKSKYTPMLIMCVVPNNRVDRYSAIKKKCCVERPVPTQVILSKNLNAKSTMSIATKVAIQMNCKIGGIPWTISIPLKGLMVVGFDVCHDTNSKGKDFGAMVASLDVNFGRYYSAVSSHTTGEELSSDLSVNLCKALDQFKHYNNCLPKKIVIYRDGVGEGQIPYVVNHEVVQIRNKLRTLYDNPNDIKMAYVIVTKKINTRLFHDGNNPSPGTIVDDVITDPTKYDFLIVAQHVTQGTVGPTSYNVVDDTSGLDVDRIQRLTYKLCHMYFNWTGTVRVPAPCQYAHKLAFLVSQAIHQSPNSILETLLYFL